MATAGNGDEFSLVPQWLKSNHGHQSPGTGSHAAGQQRDAWHSRNSASSISAGARPTAEPSLRPSSLSATPAGTAINSSSISRTDRDRERDRDRDRDIDRDRDRGGHAAWSHFHTSSRSGRAGPHPGRESASGHSTSHDADRADRYQSLGSPFKHAGHGSSSHSSAQSRHGLQRSVSDSGGTSSSANAVHSSFGSSQQQRERDRHHLGGPGGHRQGQLGGTGSSSSHTGSRDYGYGAADDKLVWRDSNRDRHAGPGGGPPGRGGNKPPPLTSMDFPSLTVANSMSGSSPRSSSSDRLGSPQLYAPSVAPYKQDFLASRGTLGWTSKLADVPGASTGAAAAASTEGPVAGAGDSKAGGKAQEPAAAAAPAAIAPAEAGNASSSGGNSARFDRSHSGSSRSSSGDGSSEAGAAAADSSRNSSPTIADAVPSASSAAAAAGAAAASVAPPTAAAAGGSSGSAPAAGPGNAVGGTSLADTLKQAVAAGNAAINGSSAAAAAAARLEAQRRQSKALVPLIPGSKAKHGTGSKGEGRGGAMRRLTSALATAAAAAATVGSNGSSAAAAKLLSPTSPVPLLKLGTQTSGTANGSSTARDGEGQGGVAAAAAAAGAAVGSSGLLSPVSPSTAVGTQAAQQGSTADGPHKASGVAALMGSHGSNGQQQHLSDRHSFFAVLKRKSSTPHHSSNGNGSSGGGSAGDVASSTDKAPGADAGSAGADAAVGEVCKGSAAAGDAQNAGSSGGAVGAVEDIVAEQQEQQQQQEAAGPTSYSLSDVPDTISSSDVSEGGCDRSSLGGSSVTSDAPAQQQQQQQQQDAPNEVAALNSHRQRCAAAAEPAGAAEHAGGSAVGGPAPETMQQKQQQQQQPAKSESAPGLWDLLDKEEEAFLRSLGWTSSDDEGDEGSWGLTQEEIAAFQAAAAATAAAAASRSAQDPSEQQGGVDVAAAKLGIAPVSLRSGDSQLFSSSYGSGAGVVSGRRGVGRVGVGAGEGLLWPQCQSVPVNGFGGQGAVWGLHSYWPPALAAACIFGGGSSSGEESDSDGAE